MAGQGWAGWTRTSRQGVWQSGAKASQGAWSGDKADGSKAYGDRVTVQRSTGVWLAPGWLAGKPLDRLARRLALAGQGKARRWLAGKAWLGWMIRTSNTGQASDKADDDEDDKDKARLGR